MCPLRALFLESTKNAPKMCPFRALSLEFTKSAHKFALFQHHIPCPQKMLDARLDFPIEIPENARVRANFVVSYSRQPFGVEGQVSPFWKLDNQG